MVTCRHINVYLADGTGPIAAPDAKLAPETAVLFVLHPEHYGTRRAVPSA